MERQPSNDDELRAAQEAAARGTQAPSTAQTEPVHIQEQKWVEQVLGEEE